MKRPLPLLAIAGLAVAETAAAAEPESLVCTGRRKADREAQATVF